MRKETINEYLDSVKKKLADRDAVSRSNTDIEGFPLAKGQCFYILDFKRKIVSFQKGVTEMLGYAPEEFTFEVPVNSFHPEDYDMVTRLIKATLMFATENIVTKDVAFFLTYRIKKKDGDYIKVLRQSNTYEIDNEGKIISNISMLSDISFLSTSNKVDWKFDAPGLDQKKFRKYVTQQYEGFFSEREIDIIKLLKQGMLSKEIGSRLKITKNTVDTHRRKILAKSNCSNTVELLNFCNQNGLG